MATKSKKSAKNASLRLFMGKMWKNTVQNEDSEYYGDKFFNLTFDNQMKDNGKKLKIKKAVITIQIGNREPLKFDMLSGDWSLQGWKNSKRNDSDADYRLSIVKNNKKKKGRNEEDEDEEEEEEEDDED